MCAEAAKVLIFAMVAKFCRCAVYNFIKRHCFILTVIPTHLKNGVVYYHSTRVASTHVCQTIN